MSNWVSLVTGAIVALGGGGGLYQLLKVRSDKRNISAGTEKARAEAADILSDTAVALLAPLRDELARMQVRVSEVEAESKELKQALVRERRTADTRIMQLELDIAARDRQIKLLSTELGRTT
jgi:TolA-binding protein